MILGKYEIVKRLGKGAFGEVMLAEDKSGNKYAIKMISMKKFAGENQYLLEYLQSEIKCLKEIDSPYVIKLHATDEDLKFKYIICEYCDGGDIITVQSKQPNKVFTLDKASEILSFVIRGLYCLHDAGFIHRDIKAENILMKTENGKEVYKLADFGFTKNINEISYTTLGTAPYMSPEIYSEQQYGFQVDMWAFGVLFYFMLNMEFPFKANLAPKTKKKSDELIKVATNFSYKTFVQNSRKKIMANCTPQIEDLFKKIFNPNAKQRINFHDIRSHPIFEKYFPEKDSLSRVLYKTRTKKLKGMNPQVMTKEILSIISMNANATSSFFGRRGKAMQNQENIIQKQKSKVYFLKQTLAEIQRSGDIPAAEFLSFKFNIQKYIIMLLKKIDRYLTVKQTSNNSQNRWKEYFKSQDYINFKKDLNEEIKISDFNIEQIYGNCQDHLSSIKKVNQYFEESFSKNTNDLNFAGPFKISYRCSTVLCYQHIVKKLKQQKTKGNLLSYLLVLVTICHAFNKIFEEKNNLKAIFEDFFKYQKKNDEEVDYLELKAYLAECTAGQLNLITKEIIGRYFERSK